MDKSEDQAEQQKSAELVRRIGGADRSAEAEMIRRYSRGLRYVLRRRTSDESLAEDLMQDTFRVALERLRKEAIDQPERLASFLYSTGRNLLIAHQRKEWRRGTVPDTDAVSKVADEHQSPYQDVSRSQNARLVRQLLSELPVPRDREILMRLYLQDQDKDEICQALGLDSLHFNRVLHRAKQRFRQLLQHAERLAQLRVVASGTKVRSNEHA